MNGITKYRCYHCQGNVEQQQDPRGKEPTAFICMACGRDQLVRPVMPVIATVQVNAWGRQGKPWTKQDLYQLSRYMKDGKSYDEIAALLGRSLVGVMRRGNLLKAQQEDVA